MEAAVFLMIVLMLVIYMIPSIVAHVRNHANFGSILALNLLLGWTGLFWVGAFVWSLTKQD